MLYKLQIKEHEEFGTMGAVILHPRARDYHDPVEGMGIAHDIIEHSTQIHPDPFIDELIAIGGFIAGRVQNRYDSSMQGVGHDLYNLFQYVPDSYLKSSSYQHNRTIKDKELLDQIKTVVWAKTSAVHIDGERRIPFDENLIVSWICEGIGRYKKRFGHLDLYSVSNVLFEGIQSRVNRWVKGADYGHKANLYVNFDRYEAYLIEDDY